MECSYCGKTFSTHEEYVEHLPCSGMVAGYLAPSHHAKSIRQDKLSQDARDLLAWAFACNLPASEVLPMPMSAAEVRLDDPVRNICEGGDGFRRHGGSDSLEYFPHRDDEDWAVVFKWDCDGDAERGQAIVQMLEGGRATQ